jgi:hypothetical protein
MTNHICIFYRNPRNYNEVIIRRAMRVVQSYECSTRIRSLRCRFDHWRVLNCSHDRNQ